MSALSDIVASLKTALEGITVAHGYETTVTTVYDYPIDLTNVQRDLSPLIMVTVNGETDKRVEDGDGVRFETTVIIDGYLRDDPANVQEAVINLSADIKKLIWSNPDLGDSCYELSFIGMETAISEEEGRCTISAVLIYYCVNGSY